jgi:RND family efflux transporter MFP subunit
MSRNSLMLLLLLVVVAASAAAPARAEARECYTRQDLSARANGFVAHVIATDGQAVKAGDTLAELDNRLHRAALREAKAGLAAAKATAALAEDGLKRLKQMAATDTVAPQELFAAETKLEQARAQQEAAQATLERAKIQLDDTFIKAEIDGTVSGLPHVKNLFVQAGQSLGRVESNRSSSNGCATEAKR